MRPIEQLSRLVSAGAWIQEADATGFGSKIALRAAEWIEGHGLLFAELGAEHEGHTHLIEAGRLDVDGDMVDAYAADGRLVATIHAMNKDEAAQASMADWNTRLESPSWRRFWNQRIANVTK